MEKWFKTHTAIVFLFVSLVSCVVFAFQTFITKDAWSLVDKRLGRIEDCILNGLCKPTREVK